LRQQSITTLNEVRQQHETAEKRAPGVCIATHTSYAMGKWVNLKNKLLALVFLASGPGRHCANRQEW
jgi:hypothetical protein